MKLLAWLTRRRKPRQTTFVYCQNCGFELCAGGSLVEDTNLVLYECDTCGHRSCWDFDTPAPLIMEGS